MKYDIKDETGNVVLTVEGDQPPSDADVEELLGAHAPAAAAPVPSQPTSLLSPKSLAPATTEAIHNFPSVSDFAASQASPDASVQQAGVSNLVSAPFKVMQGLGSDIAGGAFRLAGSLVPALRGHTQDATTGQMRPRTGAEALQNPQGSLTTPLDESIDESHIPEGIKTATHMVLGMAQGAGLGMAKAGTKALGASLTAGTREAAGNAAVRVADAVQNLRLGATPKDVMDGYTPRTLAKEGLNNLSPLDAYKKNEATFKALTDRATALKESSKATFDINKVIDETEAEAMSKKFDFNRTETKNAINDIRKTVYGQAERDGALVPQEVPTAADAAAAGRGGINAEASARFRKMVETMNGDSPVQARPKPGPRTPVPDLSQEEINAGIKSGDLAFTMKNGKPSVEYTTPEAPAGAGPKAYATAPGGAEVPRELPMNLVDGNHLKTEVGKQTAILHLAGRVRGDAAASASEKIYNMFYSKLRKTADGLGSPELQDINKKFSELIPVQNVLARAMTKEELATALGRSDIPTSKFGIIRSIMRATKTDRAVKLNDIGESLQKSGAADAAQTVGQGFTSRLPAEVKAGTLRGSLLGIQR